LRNCKERLGRTWNYSAMPAMRFRKKKSDAIFEAYREALATFGAEPEPLVKSSGSEVFGLLDWMLREFAVLGNILTNISDNSAVVSCENAFALLEHEGC